MAWTALIVAGLSEVCWAIGLKYTEGFTRFWPSLWTVLAMIASVGLLGYAVKTLPVGTAYAVWVGVGAVGTAILGVILLGEPMTPGRIAALLVIVAGIVGLKLATTGQLRRLPRRRFVRMAEGVAPRARLRFALSRRFPSSAGRRTNGAFVCRLPSSTAGR